MTDFQLPGYYTEKAARNVKARMEHMTFMNFGIGIANLAGNYLISVHTEYFDNDQSMSDEQKIAEAKDMFLHTLIHLM